MKKIFLAGLVVVVKKNYKFTKAFSLIEILVVVVLVGIVGTFAIPNIHSWMASKELRNDFFTIHKMVTTLRTEVELSVYPMGGIFIDNNNGNGLIIKIRHRSQDKYRTYKNSCENIDTQWDETETITAQTNPDIYAATTTPTITTTPLPPLPTTARDTRRSSEADKEDEEK